MVPHHVALHWYAASNTCATNECRTHHVALQRNSEIITWCLKRIQRPPRGAARTECRVCISKNSRKFFKLSTRAPGWSHKYHNWFLEVIKMKVNFYQLIKFPVHMDKHACQCPSSLEAGGIFGRNALVLFSWHSYSCWPAHEKTSKSYLKVVRFVDSLNDHSRSAIYTSPKPSVFFSCCLIGILSFFCLPTDRNRFSF